MRDNGDVLKPLVSVDGYDVHLIHECGVRNEAFGEEDMKRIFGQLWAQASKFPSLFSDYTKGDVRAFMVLFGNPRGVWFGVWREGELEDESPPLGVLYLTDVIMGFDADAHYAFYDGKQRGRERLMLEMIVRVMGAYDLHRLTAEFPSPMHGMASWLKRLGFHKEGVRREGVKREDRWFDTERYGILADEAEEMRKTYIPSTADAEAADVVEEVGV